MPLNRRNFVKKTVLAGSLLPLVGPGTFITTPKEKLTVNIFSKHLQFLSYRQMAGAAKDIGFDGVDLTVRPGGHVLPENVEDDLPEAIGAIKSEGLLSHVITTAVDDASDPVDIKLLETAANLGVKYYRMNWLKYDENINIPESISLHKREILNLSKLNKDFGLTGCYQNHAGTMVGASLYELWDLLQPADHDFMGVQYDIRHATVEGGLSWETGLKLIVPHIKTIVLKDFKWDLRDGKHTLVNTPLGEGMVDFEKYFRLLKKYNLNVPVTLHLEYPLGGAEHGTKDISIRKEVVYAAMKKDLNFIHQTWDKV